MASPPLVINVRYQIQREPIGQGGMGIVYKAYDTVTKRHVALKTMRGRLDAAALELFSKEWTVLSRINHPNIVDIFDTGEFEEDGELKPFFVMPFLPGRTFDYLIRNSSPRLTVERVIEIIQQTCRGLQAAHEQGLVHRDLKPSNIFVMDDDTVKIIDFGVVHLAGIDSVAGLKGTLQYMAPEQIEMKPTSPASDIFSLSVCCYEALTGRKPFARKTEAETVDALRRHIPPPVSELNPLVSQLLSRVIHKAMAKTPYHRFSTAREFSETLQKALNNQPIERFDRAKTQPRIDRAKKAQAEGDLQFASEVLSELEAEGHIDPEMTVLRIQIDQGIRQKSIRQLLDSARTRREEEEFPLALQKIQEVLEIDPDNADALSLRGDIEKQRGERQVENWFRLVDQHIHNQSFGQAKQALEQILKSDANNGKARDLLMEVERREQEINRLRAEKEQLYKSALSNYQDGEISSALSKLERVLELNRKSPDSAIPDRDAQYQGLYNQIRTEREAARNSYAEGRRHLADKNFRKALEVCAEFLKKTPGDPLFQALKLEAEENERQEHSAFIAEVSRRAEAEPDLDRRVNILKEAAERYPDEAHFQQSLRLIRDRRDLVNAIVAKARQYEDRGQFSEALGQWDILRNIYAQYPGLGFEVERLSRRRDEQVRDEAKGRWVEQIDRYLASGDNAKARDAARTAATEYPDDAELAGLEKLAQQAMERAAEAEVWLQRGQQLCFDRQYAEGLEALQKAASLNNKNPVIRAALLNALVEHARSVLGKDWRAAEPLIQQALNIDGGHPLAKSLQGLVQDYKRQEMVNQSITKARELQAAGDLAGALAVVEQALSSLPNEARLIQLRSTLRNLIGPVAAKAEPVVSVVAPAQVERQADLSIYTVDQSMVRTEYFKIPTMPVSAPGVEKKKPSKLKVAARRVLGRGRELYSVFSLKLQHFAVAGRHFSPLQWGAMALFPVILVGAIIASIRRPTPSEPKPVSAVIKDAQVAIDSDVTGATILVDGKKMEKSPVTLSLGEHKAQAILAGFHSDEKPFTVSAGNADSNNVRLHLEPELVRVRLSSDLKAGQVSIDGQPPVELVEGGFTDDRVSLSSEHKLTLSKSGRDYLSLVFRAEAAKVLILSSPVKAVDVDAVVISNFSSGARVYATNPALKGGIKGQDPQPIPTDGLELNSLPDKAELVVSDGTNERSTPLEISNAPTLNVVLRSDQTTATLGVAVNVPGAEVQINGRKPQTMQALTKNILLSPGKYTIHVAKDGYLAEDRAFELKKAETVPMRFDLKQVVRVASLLIEGATAGAEVLMDGKQEGAVNPDGSFSKTEISPGAHTIALRKTYFEDKELRRDFTAGQPARVSGAEATLTPFGSLEFKITADGANINYKRDDETQPHRVGNIATVRVKAGSYHVSASAPARQGKDGTFVVLAGRPTNVEWTLVPTEPTGPDPIKPKPVLLPTWHRTMGDWPYPKAGGIALFGAGGRGTFEFQVRRPPDGKAVGFIKRSGHVEFVIDQSGNNRIEYSLDQKNIERKVFVDGKGTSAPKQPVQMGSSAEWNLRIEIQLDKIVVSSGGKVLDEYARPNPESPLGKSGFKGDVEAKPLR